MTQKFLFVNEFGDYEQGGDTYEQTDFIASSAGAGDAGKPIKLDASGLIDASMIDDSDIDHGSIGGLGDDDHTQYLLATGTRNISGVIKYSSDLSSSYDARSLVDKAYADAVAAGFGPKEAVKVATTAELTSITYDNGTSGVGATITKNTTYEVLNIDGVAVSVGDRVLVKDQSSALQNGIYVVTNVGNAVDTFWILTRANDCDNTPDGEIRPGDYTAVEYGTNNGGYQYFQVDFNIGDVVGTDPITYSVFSNPTDLTAGDGIDILANSVSVDITDLIDTNYGLTENANDIRINLESDGAIVFDAINKGLEVAIDNSTIEINSNALRVKANGINDTHINWGTGASQVSGIDVPITDAGGLFTTDNVEAALAQAMTDINAVEDNSITGGNGITSTGTIGADNLNISADVDGTSIIATGGGGAQLAVKADGINETHIDWGSGLNQVDATSILLDTGGTWAGVASNVQDAIEELEANMDSGGIEYTVGTGGVTKGDLVYINADNTVVAYNTITSAQIAIGIAAETKNAAETVKVLANDTVLTGVLTGATAGTKYYWNGTNGWTTSFTTFSSGEYIWTGGVAKNSTDIHVQTMFIMKKA